MSTLKVNTVQHNTSGFNNVVQFTDGAGTQNGTLCRAWVNFNGTGTVAIRADFNVNTITDNGTGVYTINFSSALADANYCYVFGMFQDWITLGTAEKWGVQTSNGAVELKTSSACRIASKNGNNGGTDSPEITASFFR